MATKRIAQQAMPRIQKQQSMPRMQQQQQRANPQKNVQQSIYRWLRKSDIDRAFKRMA